jgi:uncharacterized protein (DUF1697 family)
MTTYAAMLRSVNVGGRKMKMADLQRLCVDLGHGDVVTYIQSGNIVFTSANRSAAAVGGELERQIEAAFHMAVAVVLRTKAELAAAIKANPFPATGVDLSKLHVTFLTARPDRSRVKALDVPASGRDEFRVGTREVYLHCPDGYGNTKLTTVLFERKLGVVGTTRNWNTTTKLLALAGG